MTARTILIVEDQPALARTYAGFLWDGPYYVRRVETGAQALSAIDDEPIAVLLDLKLPDMSGIDLLREIRGRKSATSVVALAASGWMMSAIEAMRLGADDFLVKPFTAERLRRTLDASIENRSVLSTGEMAQFYSCFISFSSDDQEFAIRLYDDLQEYGVRCWISAHDMRTGDRIRETIDEQIRVNDKLLLILSENSVSSNWVENEVEAAMAKEVGRKTVLFPVRIDAAVEDSSVAWASTIKRTRHIGDFSGWKNPVNYQREFERLLRDLRVEL